VIGALAGAWSHGALAAPPPPPPSCAPPLPQTLSSAHFTVSYTGDPKSADYITESQAGEILASAERARDTYLALGFPAPQTGPSGVTTDIYVIDLSTFSLSSYICFGTFDFNAGDVGKEGMAYSLGFDVFEEIEYNVYFPPGAGDPWLTQGIAAWASWKALGYPAASTSALGPYEMSLDCYDATFGSAKCSKDLAQNLGGTRWPFYEYLTERFGSSFILDLLAAANTAGDSLAGLQNALVARGTTLAAEYSSFAAKLLYGGWTAPALNVVAPAMSGSAIKAGAATGDTPAQHFGVNHLATRFIEIDRGDGDGAHPCYAATLTVTVQIPAGITSQPVFYWGGGGSSPVALTLSGSTATTSVPWDTCLWTSKGYLSLPNTSSTANGNDFVVSTHIDVNTALPATATPPPAPTSTYGPSVNVPADVPPDITVLGPGLMRLSATAKQLRIIIQSNGEGSVRARLGSLDLGTRLLRPGGNDLRFTLPKGVLSRLRVSASTNVITLTPVSADGTNVGTAVTQRVIGATIKKPAKKKPKPRVA
jgi:hypothetical protein